MAWEECPPHPFLRIFALRQRHAAGLINSSNLSTFDQTATDLLGRVYEPSVRHALADILCPEGCIPRIKRYGRYCRETCSRCEF